MYVVINLFLFDSVFQSLIDAQNMKQKKNKNVKEKRSCTAG